MAKRATTAAGTDSPSHPPIYEPTVDPNTWEECLWSPGLNQYVCHDIPASQVPKHVRAPRKHLNQPSGGQRRRG
jgi:hypothetical protein